MRRNILIIAVAVLLTTSIVAASIIIPVADQAKDNAKAPEKSPVIGENWEFERVDFIHYAKPQNPGKPDKPEKTQTCYKLLGVQWKTLPVDYVVNPTNPQNLSESFIISAISTSSETWDDATSAELLSNTTLDYNAQYGVQNFENAIVFGDYPNDNVIGVTSIWYVRGKNKQIVEFDMILNTRFLWGDASTATGVMDLQNIATHELGHAVGLNDIYQSTCSEVTMYGYSNYNEVKKRTLEAPDVAGLQEMYTA